jgi:hypothetical protein
VLGEILKRTRPVQTYRNSSRTENSGFLKSTAVVKTKILRESREFGERDSHQK